MTTLRRPSPIIYSKRRNPNANSNANAFRSSSSKSIENAIFTVLKYIFCSGVVSFANQICSLVIIVKHSMSLVSLIRRFFFFHIKVLKYFDGSNCRNKNLLRACVPRWQKLGKLVHVLMVISAALATIWKLSMHR